MKKRVFLVFTLVLIVLGGCAPKKYIPKPNEEFYGTWTNEKAVPQRVVIFAGGFKQYNRIGDTVPTYSEGIFKIQSRWQDVEGNIWYKLYGTDLPGGEKFQSLVKLSKSATVYERVHNFVAEFNPKSFPTKITTDYGTYDIFFRSAD